MKLIKLVEIRNKLGMHARPAMKLFELVQSFDAVVTLRNQSGTEANANSVIALLMLDSAQGGWIEVQVEGRQQEEAMQTVVELFNSKFDEE